MNKEIRKQEMYKRLRKSNFLTIEELAQDFQVSEMTIRRDLAELESQGIVMRGLGGVYPIHALDEEISIENKKIQHINEKKKIAVCAVDLIKEDMTIFLDSGSTCYEVACAIKARSFEHLNIITQDLSIINYLKDVDGINLIVLGGTLSHETSSMNGLLTKLCLERLSADLAFLGAASISKELKIYTPSENKVLTKIEMRKNAKRAVLLADSSKFKEIHLNYIQDVSDFSLFITDSEISDEMEEKLRKAEVKYTKV